MTILTTTRPLTNEQRLLNWRMRKYRHDTLTRIAASVRKLSGEIFGDELQTSGDTGPSDSRCHSASKLGAAFKYLANLLGLAAWFGGIFAVTYIVGALLAVPEPETRTFTRADGTSYERTQSEWHIESQTED